jgi:hypothetical protein
VKEKHLFTSSHFPPNKIYLNFQVFLFDLKILFYHGSRLLFMHFIFFPWLINYDYVFWCNKSSTHSLLIWFWFWFNFSPFFEIMASRMVTSYGPQTLKWIKNRLRSHV